MCRKPILTLLFFFAFVFNLFSQSSFSKHFNLTWKDAVTLQLNPTNRISVPLVIDQTINKDHLPLYATTFNVQSYGLVREYHIKNVKYEPIDSKYLQSINNQSIPNQITAQFNISKARNQPVGALELIGLVRQNGKVYKVTSFDLDYQLESNSNKRTSTIATNKSVLANGTWFKFAIDTSGVYKLNKAFLNNLGINTNTINPNNIRIFGNGGALLPQLNSSFRNDDLQENAIEVVGGGDGIFNDDDYVLFYGKGPESWEINHQNIEQSRHINHIYSDKAYYFITVDQGQGLRINNQASIAPPHNVQISSYHDFVVHELDEINLFANGQQWLGEDFSHNNNQTINIPFENILSTEPIYIRARGAAISFTPTQMTASINGQPAVNLNFNALSSTGYTLATTKEDLGTILNVQHPLNINLDYQNSGNPSARAYLDYLEIIGSKQLKATGKQFTFRNILANNPSLVYQFEIDGVDQIDQVWDISNPLNPQRIANTSATQFSFKMYGGPDKNYVVLNNSDFLEPEILDRSSVENQNLHGLENIDYLIITQSSLAGEAENLANYHKQNSHLNTAVVTLDKIYNEFGSGSPDITAIRDFVRFLYLKGNTARQLKYVCLFGDASFDFKDRIANNNNIVPSFQSFESFNLVTSYVTDDYFGMMDDNEGELRYSDTQDIAISRYPVTTVLEASEAIKKTLNYYNHKSFGSWRNLITFVADDPDRPNEFVLQQALDNLTKDIATTQPQYNIKKIYADAHQQETTAGGERYPTVNEAISNAVETGTLLVDYFGHGGVNGWANERILEVPEIQNWYNPYTLPLFITVTCEFTRFDNPLQPTAGEFTFLNRQGGATNMISTTREIFITVGQSFNDNLIKKLLGTQGENYTIAEALMYAKHDFSTVQRLFISNFGDPAMPLAVPKPNIVLTKMNDVDITQQKDTLKALSKINFEGEVTDQNGQILNQYNGVLSATIFDKPLDKTTLDNDGFGRIMDFQSIESKVFKGQASITNGQFKFEFIVPKDIRIAYGHAKVSLYGQDQNQDHGGYNLDLIIGGINTNAPDDQIGPEISLFMNDESFVDGGNTNQSPLLYAVLEDSSGINTSITAVDHDIIAILDGDEANPIVLNDYYETELNDFKKGKVKYPLRNLEPGLHTIKLKCWDTYNNPSESTLNFVVVDNNNLVLSNVLNYPNPFVNYTEFWFNHNKPNEPLDVQVQIFTISGKLIRTLNRSIQSDGLLSREISWNGLDDFGNKIGKGVYIYKLKVKSGLTNTSAEKIEKLVILQ